MQITQLEKSPQIVRVSGRLGATYYNPLKATLYILEDTTDPAHYDLTHMLLEQASPEIVITGSRSDDKFIEVVRAMSMKVNLEFICYIDTGVAQPIPLVLRF
ncbi:hypothetical protein JB92DRAFT_2838413 [Gautieria morchelliformis]|nr:hypothetical protein JB92DRAFT_2838413 [Gautieria morchelliformis]